MHKKVVLILVSILGCLSVSAGGQELPEKPAPISESVTVSEEIAPENIAGSVTAITKEDIEESRMNNTHDVLRWVPGVQSQSRFGTDECKLSIRGSGLRANYHGRGLNLFVNAIPYMDADGFSDFEAIEMMAMERVEVWKSASSLHYGGNSLGGAINFITDDGSDRNPLSINLTGGSHGFFKGQVSSGGRKGRFGYYLSVSDMEYDGYREHSDQGRQRLLSNFSWDLDQRTSLKVDLIYANIAEKLPGSLTREEFSISPRLADAENVEQDWGRFIDYTRGSVQLRRAIGSSGELSATVYGSYRNMVHPIFQVLDQDTRNFGVDLFYKTRFELGRFRNRIVVGVTPQVGLSGERRFENNGGRAGRRTASFNTVAQNLGLYIEDQIDLNSKWMVIGGARADLARRKFTNLLDAADSDIRTYRALSPKLGVVYRLFEDMQLFVTGSRSFEPPVLLELTSYGRPGFLDLEAQRSSQIEGGARWTSRRFQGEMTLYNARVRNEILNSNIRPFTGAPFTIPTYRSVNSTSHIGFEAAGNLALRHGIDLRGSYTYSNFRFRRDQSFTGNHLPGVPPHMFNGEVRYTHRSGYWVAPNIEWLPQGYYVNSSNTERTDKYSVLNLKAGKSWENFSLYMEASNLLDRKYSGTVQVDVESGRYYETSAGRSAYVGLRYKF
jgi:iron complex outermembrane recepter protein